jgi:hypothetical protein
LVFDNLGKGEEFAYAFKRKAGEEGSAVGVFSGFPCFVKKAYAKRETKEVQK